MPSATHEDRERATKLWGGIDDWPIVQWLQKRGFKLHENWTWTVEDKHEPTEEELFAIGFLIDEWDYAGLVKEAPKPKGKKR